MLHRTLVICFFASLSLMGCQAHSSRQTVVMSWQYAADAEDVWQAAIKTADEMKLDVRNIDAAHDTITTNWQQFDMYQDYADCAGALPDADFMMRHVIKLTTSDAGPKLTVQSSFRMERESGAGVITPCDSTGKFEKRFHDKLEKTLKK